MTGRRAAVLAVILMAGSFTIAGTAYAFEPTHVERTSMDQLSHPGPRSLQAATNGQLVIWR